MRPMHAVPLIAACMWLAPAGLRAQQVAPLAPIDQAAPAALAPFTGTSQVFRDDKPLGRATMRLVNTAGARWRIDLDILGTRGLAGIAGINIQQSTVFDVVGGQYRPVTQATVRHALFRTRKTTGIYDWGKGAARWTGDIKASRRGREIALQPGDMSGLLINLALVRDARPGATLRYRFVDDGRMRPHEYAASAETEGVRVGDIDYEARRIDRVQSGNDRTVVWVARDVPLPVRIHMKDGDDPALDLMLIQYQGATP